MKRLAKVMAIAALIGAASALSLQSAHAFWGGGPWGGYGWGGWGGWGNPVGHRYYPDWGGYRGPYLRYPPWGWGGPWGWGYPGWGYPAWGYPIITAPVVVAPAVTPATPETPAER